MFSMTAPVSCPFPLPPDGPRYLPSWDETAQMDAFAVSWPSGKERNAIMSRNLSTNVPWTQSYYMFTVEGPIGGFNHHISNEINIQWSSSCTSCRPTLTCSGAPISHGRPARLCQGLKMSSWCSHVMLLYVVVLVSQPWDALAY